MQLESLRVTQLRHFREPLELAELAPGINVIFGPNESGKSTLVRALRAAFFERHRSNSVDDLRPWGDSAAAPEVQLRFRWQGEIWQLSKRFLQQRRCDLSIGSQRYEGAAAEEKLAELLGFQFSGRGASRPEHWGIPGLLWIEQGAGQDLRQAVEFASDHLQGALGADFGAVASSSGDAITQRVEQERRALLTPTGRASGELKSVQERCDEQAVQRLVLSERIASYRHQVDRLSELLATAQLDEGRPWLAFRQQAAAAQQELDTVQAWQQQLAADEQAQAGCESVLASSRAQLERLDGMTTELAERQRKQTMADAELAALQQRCESLGVQRQQAHDAFQFAQAVLDHARWQERHRVRQQRVEQARSRCGVLQAALQKAQTQQRDLLAARAQYRPVADQQVAQLRLAQRALDDLRLRQASVATRIRYALQAGGQLYLEDQLLEGAGEQRLVAPVRLTVPGIGDLWIEPGGADLGELQRAIEGSSAQCADLLATLGVPDLVAAEQALLDARQAKERVERLVSELAASAPEGIDALRAEQAVAERELSDAEQSLLELPLRDGETLPIAEAEAAAASAAAALSDAERAERTQALAHAAGEVAARAAAEEVQRLQTALAADALRQERSRAELQRDKALQQLHELGDRIAEQRVAIAAARPELLAQDVARFTRTAEQLEVAAQQRQLEIRGLRSALEALGAEGLEERFAELEQQQAQSQRRRDELEVRAAALDLLLRLLQEQRDALTQRLQAPLQRHLAHYLQLLFPQAILTVDERLVPVALTRPRGGGAEIGALEALSFGAREQMGLIARLAYADLLREAGRPTLILLDDVLVNTDTARLVQMKRILFDAAQRHQVLLFTCHPDNWLDLGVSPRDIRGLCNGAAM